MNSDKKISLAKKLTQVMSDCNHVKKDGRNDFQNYKYVSSTAILKKVNESLVQHGIATLVESEILSSTFEKNDKGKNERYVVIKTKITLIDADSDQTYTISGIGSGVDGGDKAIAKAQTMANKYAWMMALNISTGDDPEAEDSVDEPRKENRVNHYQSFPKNSHSSAKDYVDFCQQLENASEYSMLSQEMKANWTEFTKDEKDAITQAVIKTKKRLGIVEKSN